MEINEINQRLLAGYESTLREWIPGGSVINGEYTPLNPTRADKNPGSFKINVSTGYWKDFACGDSGTDPVSLYAYIHGLKQGDAILALRKILKGDSKPLPTKSQTQTQSQAPKISPKRIPAGTKPPEFYNENLGTLTAVWTYRYADGEVFGYVARFERDGAKKNIAPMIFDGTTWRWSGFGPNRPLYNLDKLAKHPAGKNTIFIFEGEKTADAASKILGDEYCVITWQGGSQAVAQTDWTPLKDHKVAIFPDNDKPGIECADKIAALIGTIASKIKIVNPPKNTPKGWDIADADETWTKDYLIDYIKENLRDPVALKQSKAEKLPPPTIAKKAYEYDRYDPKEHLDGMPFKILGYNDGDLYFLPHETLQVMSVSEKSMSKNTLISLAPIEMWESRGFYSKGKFRLDRAIDILIRQARGQGIYDVGLIRGRGAWWDDGRVALHLGDRIISEGQGHEIQDYKTRYIYERAKTLPINVKEELSYRDGRGILELTKSLNWENPSNAYLLAGWIFLAPVCGALDWRPHIWITGNAGAGKSWLMSKIVKFCLGNMALFVQSKTTEPGIRQELKADALPIIFDEAETEEGADVDRLRNILTLMRQSSSENEEASILKGSASGKATSYSIRSMWAFASIGIGVKNYADDTRLSILRLRPNYGPEAAERFENIKELHDRYLSRDKVAKLHSRAIKMIPVIRETASLFVSSAAEIIGSRRLGDQVGTLLAGAWCLCHDTVPTIEEVKEFVQGLDLVNEKTLSDMREEESLLGHILQKKIRVDLHEYTVGDLVGRATKTFNYPESLSIDMARDALKRHAIMATDESIVIGNNADAIKTFLKGTQWESIKYFELLRRIEGAKAYNENKAIWLGGAVMKATEIPIQTIFKGV